MGLLPRSPHNTNDFMDVNYDETRDLPPVSARFSFDVDPYSPEHSIVQMHTYNHKVNRWEFLELNVEQCRELHAKLGKFLEQSRTNPQKFSIESTPNSRENSILALSNPTI